MKRMLAYLKKLFRRSGLTRKERRDLYKGLCAQCGHPVYHAYPWYTARLEKGGQPLHEECFQEWDDPV